MKAIQFKRKGLPKDVLELVEVEKPQPKAGEVLIKVKKANIVPADIMFIQGMYGIRPELPQIAGFEATGVIEAVGEGVAYPQGTAVIFTGTGVWAEYVCVDARAIIPKPEAMPDHVAAQAFINPLTAYGMLMEAQLQAGDWLLLTAANSAFSKFVIQLAASRGIQVIGTVRSDEQKEGLLALGAKGVINEKTENLFKSVKTITEGQMVKVAFDAVGGELGDLVLNALQSNGLMLVYGALSLQPVPVNNGLMIFKNLTMKGFWLTTWIMGLSKEQRQQIIPEVLGMLTKQSLKADIEAEYDLKQFQQAIQHMESQGRKGKILLNMNE